VPRSSGSSLDRARLGLGLGFGTGLALALALALGLALALTLTLSLSRTGVGAEDEEERERRHEDGEGQRGKHEGGEASARVHDAAEVLVAAAERVDHHDEERDQRHEGQLLGERLVDAAARQRAHVAQETVARPVADPVVVHEDGAAVLAIVLGVGLTLLPPRLAVARFRWEAVVGVRERGPSGDILRI